MVKQSKAKQSKAKQSKAKQSKAKQSKAKQSKAKQSKAKQSKALDLDADDLDTVFQTGYSLTPCEMPLACAPDSVANSDTLLKLADDMGLKGADAVDGIKKLGDSAGKIRGKMSNAGNLIRGTTIPKYFNLSSAGKSFHVHPNATMHMAEYINTGVSIKKTDSTEANGRKSLEFRIEVESVGFKATIENIWLDDEDISNFLLGLNSLAAKENDQASLDAMSEFSVSFEASDSLGHFIGKFTLECPRKGNTAIISIPFETQSLMNFGREFQCEID